MPVVSKIGGTFLGVPMVRIIIVYWRSKLGCHECMLFARILPPVVYGAQLPQR